MTKVVLTGATRVRRQNGRLPYFPRRHLMLVTGVTIVVLLLIGLVPSTDVEANKTRIPLKIDGLKPGPLKHKSLSEESPGKELLEITQPAQPMLVETLRTDSEATRRAREEAERKTRELATLGRWQSLVVESGDNLSSLFAKQGLGARVVYDISKTPNYGRLLADIRPGQTLNFRINSKNELTQFRYVRDRLNHLLFQKTDNGYIAEKIVFEPQVRTAYVEGKINDSLFLASQKAGLTDRLTMELAGIFGWDIDFALDIREGDRFNVVYEERFLLKDGKDDEKLGNGNILAATFVNKGKSYTAIRYTDSKGRSSYYTPDGKSMRKAFLRTPVEFTRISSRFNPNRLHPIFKTKRPHRGVDYAAPAGTPIKAAGDGRIQFSGWQNGFGNVVFIEHPNNIVTVYAHQSRLNKRFKKGSRVNQGDIIGYVGSTGWATGPHLHYEFRVNGEHRNPVTVKFPDAKPVPKAEMARFKQHKVGILAQLEQHQKAYQGTMLASQ